MQNLTIRTLPPAEQPGPQPANAKLREHGFTVIHNVVLRPRRDIQTRQPYTLEVTGIYKGPKRDDTPTLLTKSIAAGDTSSIRRWAASHKITITTTITK